MNEKASILITAAIAILKGVPNNWKITDRGLL